MFLANWKRTRKEQKMRSRRRNIMCNAEVRIIKSYHFVSFYWSIFLRRLSCFSDIFYIEKRLRLRANFGSDWMFLTLLIFVQIRLNWDRSYVFEVLSLCQAERPRLAARRWINITDLKSEWNGFDGWLCVSDGKDWWIRFVVICITSDL